MGSWKQREERKTIILIHTLMTGKMLSQLDLTAENTWSWSVLYTALFGWVPDMETNQVIYGVKAGVNNEVNAPHFHYLC